MTRQPIARELVAPRRYTWDGTTPDKTCADLGLSVLPEGCRLQDPKGLGPSKATLDDKAGAAA